MTTVAVQGLAVNLSPDAFHMWATHYYKCRQDFRAPTTFSPVPYFLLCRAIELELKARHLVTKDQSRVKKDYGHDIRLAYLELPAADQRLATDEIATLEEASVIYASKGFEYFKPLDAMLGYRHFPDLASLDRIALRLIEGGAPLFIDTTSASTPKPSHEF